MSEKTHQMLHSNTFPNKKRIPCKLLFTRNSGAVSVSVFEPDNMVINVPVIITNN